MLDTDYQNISEDTYQDAYNTCLHYLQSLKNCTPEIIEQVVSLTCTDRGISSKSLIKRLRIHLENSINIKIEESYHIIHPHVRRWLTTARKNDIGWNFWKKYKKILQGKGRTNKDIDKTDKETDDILTILSDPKADDSYQTKGLVIGDVQSGKTENFTGLLCKAVDAGYKIVIVIAGTQESLRYQTQLRLDSDFVGTSNNAIVNQKLKSKNKTSATLPHIITLTSSASDFDGEKNPPNKEEITFLVIKKNVFILNKVIDYFSKHQIQGPALILDDEADNASPNSNKANTDPARTNELIRKLVNLFPLNSYVGYTATPYANIFINPYTTADFESAEDKMLSDDLFPKDFISTISAPSTYIGAKQIFGYEEDDENETQAPYKHCVTLTNSEDDFLDKLKKKKFINLTLPKSLTDALITFILAKAIRGLRGQDRQHCSMLINVSPLIGAHNYLFKAITKELTTIVTAIKAHINIPSAAQHHTIIKRIKHIWDTQYAGSNEISQQWKDITHYLSTSEYIEKLPHNIIVVNSESQNNLDYTAHRHGLTAVIIGGNGLSRGLTLEGLTVSYFLRNSKQYDTLMQMGRWFGYRPCYADICRIFLTAELRNHFAAIAYATDELKAFIKQFHNTDLTPKEFGIRIRNSATGLLITARNKMRTAKKISEWVSFDGCRKETHCMTNDTAIIRNNIIVFDNFIKRINENYNRLNPNKEQKDFIWEGVPSAEIKSFIMQCSDMFCHNNLMTDFVYNKTLLNYLMELGNTGTTFDVALISLKTSKVWTKKYTVPGTDITVLAPSRNPVRNTNEDKLLKFNNNRFFSKGDELGKTTAADIANLKNKLGIQQLEEHHFRQVENRNPLLMLAYAYIPEQYSITASKIEDVPLSDFTKLVCGYGFSFPDNSYSRKKAQKVEWTYNAVAQYRELHPTEYAQYEEDAQENEYDDNDE